MKPLHFLRRRWRAIGLTSAFSALALLAVDASGVIGRSHPPASVRIADANVPARFSYAPVVKKALPAVVNIASAKVVRSPQAFSGRGDEEQMDPLFRQFFGDQFGPRFNVPKERREQSLGSGVIISPEGYILTNSHVVDGATDVRVTLGDKRELKAEIIGADPKTDIAVLKIDATNLPVMTLSDSSRVEVGDVVLAMGNPFGVGQTVTSGIVSATGRGGLGIEAYEDFIQTDAAINPGNSGGALVNERGELIGINTAILSRTGGNHGVGFAVPVNLARQVMDQLLKDGRVNRAYLGVIPQDITPAIAKAFGVKEMRGALVGDLSADGPAKAAGLQTGDIIVGLNGKQVESANQLRMTISMMPPDSTVSLKVIRDGAEKVIPVKLGALPTEERAASGKEEASPALDGVDVQNLNARALRQFELPEDTQGVVVTEVSPASPAAAAGLRPGDVIQQVNRKPVKNVAEFASAVRSAGSNPLLLVNRQGNTLYLAV